MRKSFTGRLKASARIILDGRHGFLATVVLFVTLCNVILNYILSNVFSGSGILQFVLQFACSALMNVILYLLLVGQQRLYLNLCRDEVYGFGDLFASFTGYPEQIALYSFLQCILQSVLTNSMLFLMLRMWSLTWSAIVTSTIEIIVLLIAYALIQISVHFVLCLFVDHPSISAKNAIKESVFMMKGRKWKLIRIYLSFIGLDLLALLSFGIGLFFINPYKSTVLTLFYMEACGETIPEFPRESY